jgi:hypothetical protein
MEEIALFLQPEKYELLILMTGPALHHAATKQQKRLPIL